MNRLEGKTAVVTGGGTKGIGRATTARLVEEGAFVFITGRREHELQDAIAEIGRNVSAIPGDITRPADLDRLYDAVIARGLGIDILFANAGAASFAPFAETTEADFDRIFDVNVKGTFFTVQKALPLLNKGASVIVNASTSADRGVHGMGAYAASKAAVRSFVRTWATELAKSDIRVNAISPGPIETSGVVELVGEENVVAYNRSLADTLPIGRTGLPHEVAAAVAFLASNDSSFIIGTNMYVDGGANQT